MAIRSTGSKEYRQAIQILKQARLRANLTQQALADRLSRPQSFVAKYERAERRIDVIEFIEIAQALKLRASALVAKIESGQLDI